MLKMTFESGRGPIEVATDCNGNGEAYFTRDDLIAAVKDGEFTHPMLGIAYRVLMPVRRNAGRAVLQTQTWRDVSEATVFDATSGS